MVVILIQCAGERSQLFCCSLKLTLRILLYIWVKFYLVKLREIPQINFWKCLELHTDFKGSFSITSFMAMLILFKSGRLLLCEKTSSLKIQKKQYCFEFHSLQGFFISLKRKKSNLSKILGIQEFLIWVLILILITEYEYPVQENRTQRACSSLNLATARWSKD